jgi:hypothetical protein
MAEKAKRSRLESIRLWIKAVGIPVVLALLGLWQFWLKEVRWPGEAPVNLTTELSVREAGFSGASARDDKREDKELEAIEFEVTARNPSTRGLYLLRNLWVAYGVKIERPQNGDWLQVMADQINGNHQIIAGKYYDADPPVPVATGNVFTDVGLHPGEKIVRTFVFYVPQGVYDFVEVEVRLPTTTTEIPGHPGEPIAGVEYKVRADHAARRYIGLDRMAPTNNLRVPMLGIWMCNGRFRHACYRCGRLLHRPRSQTGPSLRAAVCPKA